MGHKTGWFECHGQGIWREGNRLSMCSPGWGPAGCPRGKKMPARVPAQRTGRGEKGRNSMEESGTAVAEPFLLPTWSCHNIVNQLHSTVGFLPRGAQTVKILPAMQDIWVRPLGQKDPLEEGMVTHFYSCLKKSIDRRAWRATDMIEWLKLSFSLHTPI